MNIWDSYTHMGNQDFADNNFEFALSHYDQALSHANSMLHNNNEYDFDYIINLILISHCNLANCYFELNWIKKACEQFEIAHQFLKSAIVLSNNNQLQIAALKSNKLLKQKWLNSLKTYIKKIPDIQTLRSYSKSMCSTYNIHSFKQMGVNHDHFSNLVNHNVCNT